PVSPRCDARVWTGIWPHRTLAKSLLERARAPGLRALHARRGASTGIPTHSPPALKFHALSGGGRHLPSLGKECFGVFGKRGEFQTHVHYLGVQRLTGDYLGIDVREWWMIEWLQGEPDIGIGCDLPLNRGLGVVCTG